MLGLIWKYISCGILEITSQANYKMVRVLNVIRYDRQIQLIRIRTLQIKSINIDYYIILKKNYTVNI